MTVSIIIFYVILYFCVYYNTRENNIYRFYNYYKNITIKR